jgi:hypothetical protein
LEKSGKKQSFLELPLFLFRPAHIPDSKGGSEDKLKLFGHPPSGEELEKGPGKFWPKAHHLTKLETLFGEHPF